MWQRIQTLYLAVSTALLFILFFSDVYTTASPEGMQYTTYLQLQKPYFGILLGILFAMTVLALITFKVRILQMRLATLARSGERHLQMDRHLPAARRHLRFPRRPRLLPGPADGRERLPHPRIAEAGPEEE